jgi:FkbM family methyltransferase
MRRAAHRVMPRVVRDAGWNGLNLAASVRALGVREGRRLVAAANEPATGTSDPIILIQSAFREADDAWLPTSPAPAWIFDLGANIGDSAVWFLARFPGARVLSIEPEPGNYELARRNLEPYGDRVILLHGAVWPSDGEVRVRTVPVNPAGSEVGVVGNTACAAVSIPTLMAQYKIPRIGIFKCDRGHGGNRLSSPSGVARRRRSHLHRAAHGELRGGCPRSHEPFRLQRAGLPRSARVPPDV